MRTLLVANRPGALNGLLGDLRLREMTILAVAPRNAERIISTWRPEVAILLGSRVSHRSLLRSFERALIPIIVVGSADGAAPVDDIEGVPAAVVPGPPDAAELTSAVEAVTGRTVLVERPGRIEVGDLVVDLLAEIVTVDGKRVRLPPKEFAILTELALRPAVPVHSSELVRLVWPAHAAVTCADVHRHVYRLRKRLGDDQRPSPLIRNRRGFGYVLDGSA